MASDKAFLDLILERVSGVEGVSYRPMMGEFLLYVKGKLVGGIYDDRLLVKDFPSSGALLPDARAALPYEGAKTPLLRIERLDDPDFLKTLFNTLYEEL